MKTKLNGERRRLVSALKQAANHQQRLRIQTVLTHLGRQQSLDLTAGDAGVHRSTVSCWLRLYRSGGVQRLMAQRNRSSRHPQARRDCHKALLEQLNAGPGANAREIREWLWENQGIRVSLRSIARHVKAFAKTRPTAGAGARKVATPATRKQVGIVPHWPENTPLVPPLPKHEEALVDALT